MSHHKFPIPNHQSQSFYIEKYHLDSLTMIYKGKHSPNYYLRLNTVQGYITKSLRTPSLEKAKAKAFQLIPELSAKIDRDLPVKRQTVESIFNWYLQTPYATELGKVRLSNILRCGRVLKDYFQKKSIDTISLSDWIGYWPFRSNYYKGTPFEGRCRTESGLPSIKSLRGERSTYHQVVQAAYSNGLIRMPIEMPPVPRRFLSEGQNPTRPSATFTPAQYSKFRKALNKWADEPKYQNNSESVYTAQAVRAVLWTQRHCGARLKELLSITHDDLEKRTFKLTDGTTHTTFAIYVKSTKSLTPHSRYAILTHTGYKHLCAFIDLKIRFGISCEQDTPVFTLWRTRTKSLNDDQVGMFFRRIVKEAGLYQIGDRTNRTSATTRILRRYYIIRQIDSGTPISKVAMAVGHTESTCRRYYDSVMRERYESSVYEGSYHPSQLTDDD